MTRLTSRWVTLLGVSTGTEPLPLSSVSIGDAPWVRVGIGASAADAVPTGGDGRTRSAGQPAVRGSVARRPRWPWSPACPRCRRSATSGAVTHPPGSRLPLPGMPALDRRRGRRAAATDRCRWERGARWPVVEPSRPGEPSVSRAQRSAAPARWWTTQDDVPTPYPASRLSGPVSCHPEVTTPSCGFHAERPGYVRLVWEASVWTCPAMWESKTQ